MSSAGRGLSYLLCAAFTGIQLLPSLYLDAVLHVSPQWGMSGGEWPPSEIWVPSDVPLV